MEAETGFFVWSVLLKQCEHQRGGQSVLLHRWVCGGRGEVCESASTFEIHTGRLHNQGAPVNICVCLIHFRIHHWFSFI